MYHNHRIASFANLNTKLPPPNFFNDYYIILTEAKKVNNTALITGS